MLKRAPNCRSQSRRLPGLHLGPVSLLWILPGTLWEIGMLSSCLYGLVGDSVDRPLDLSLHHISSSVLVRKEVVNAWGWASLDYLCRRKVCDVVDPTCKIQPNA